MFERDDGFIQDRMEVPVRSGSRGKTMDRRGSSRYVYRMPVIVHVVDEAGRSSIVKGQLQNVSIGGMCFSTARDPFVPSETDLYGRIRMEKAGSGMEMPFRVQWSREQPDGSVHFGVQFDHVRPGIISAVKDHDRILVWLGG
ncbi:MAG TPA: PilZ domain-containing protein [Armatimonadota bacterium]|nr:PilZ domain-containing protein [Armatimonadota bacterium]